MRVVLAISGGVDSIAMLDIACRRLPKEEIVVAHFDHGIRDNSGLDAEFVRRKAAEYGVEFYAERAELGEGASEAEAREKRYEFLAKVAGSVGGEIWTAHHLDDLVETVAINLLRGTGWRGLAGLDRAGIRRPFLETEMFYEPLDRATIYEYAAKRRLEYREDPSNSWEEYLRNRVRRKLDGALSFEQKLEIYELWREQKKLKREIDEVVAGLLPSSEEGEAAPVLDRRDEAGAELPSRKDETWQRSWFTNLDEKVALELLRAGTLCAGISATRPQLLRFLEAIKTYPSGKSFNLPQDKLVRFSKKEFVL